MNELCLWEVAKIHFVVSNMDFCAGRSLMSLHVLDFVCVCFYACVLQPNYACESIFLFLVFMCLFRCMSCVASSWGCQWNTHDHTCSDMDDVVDTNIIKQRQVRFLKG